MMIDGNKDSTVGERKLIWDEENRLLAVDENGFVSNYWYDAVSNELSVVNKVAFPVKGISAVLDGSTHGSRGVLHIVSDIPIQLDQQIILKS